MHLKTIQECRVCQSPHLIDVLSLGDQFLQGSFCKGDIVPPTRKIPLTLTLCDASKGGCGLLQLKHSVPPEILYRKYWYKSGTNQTMKDHLLNIVENAYGAISSDRQDYIDNFRVLDIGCNDGTLLKYYPARAETVGIDPGDHTPKCTQFINDTFPSKHITGKFDIITSIACFYDLEDPINFAQAVKDALGGCGVWVVEVAYLPAMLKNNAYDNICHEHLEYYSLATLEFIFQFVGLKVVKAELNDINCGSIQVWVTHKENNSLNNEEWKTAINKIRDNEFNIALDTTEPYLLFGDRAAKLSEELCDLLITLKEEGKTVHVYGASTKGNTILQCLQRIYCKPLMNLIEYAADRNPEKHGATTLGTWIPIISEEKSRAIKPDYYLVLPWGFRKEFIEREKDSGIKMIFPLPTLEII